MDMHQSPDDPMTDGNPTRRRNQRVVLPVLLFCFLGDDHASIDWSLGGFQIETYGGEMLESGTIFPVSAAGPEGGPMTPVGILARVVRLRDRRLAAVFVEMDEHAFDFLEAMMMRRHQYLASLAATARAVA